MLLLYTIIDMYFKAKYKNQQKGCLKMNNFIKVTACCLYFFCISAISFPKIDAYSGISGGFNSQSFKYQVSLDHKINNYNQKSINTSLDSGGAGGDIFIGIGKTFNKYSINLRSEVDLAMNTGEGKYHYQVYVPVNNGINSFTNNYSITEKSNLNAGISIIPGFFVTENNLLYTRVGYRIGSLDTNITSNRTDDYQFGQLGDKKHTVQGYRLGIGVESSFTKNLVLKAEWDYTGYNAAKNTDTIKQTDGNLTVNSQTKMSSNNVQLGLSYYFAAPSHNPNHFLDPVAWLENKWGHSGVPVPDEDQTMVASNDQPSQVLGDKTVVDQ